MNANALIGALVYDANGNVTKKCTGAGVTSDCSGGNILTLTFDAKNRLAQAIGPNGTEAYGYDDQGRRIRKTVNGVNTFYLYNGQDIVAEYQDGWAKPTAITLHGAGTDDPIARYTKNESGGYDKAYYHADGLGSVVALSKDDGTIPAVQMFDSWGNQIAASSIGTVPAYGYTGREPDGTGLIYYRARYYDPAIGRFVAKDPIGMAGGLNYYAYVGNNPINYADPSGLAAMGGYGMQTSAPVTQFQLAENTTQGTMNDATTGLVTAGAGTGVLPGIGPTAGELMQGLRGGVFILPLALPGDTQQQERTYVTYQRTNPLTNQVYSGMTSGYGDANSIVRARVASPSLNDPHYQLDILGFLPPVVDRSSPYRDAIRGREQQLVDSTGGAQSVNGGSANKYNAVADWNLNRPWYMLRAAQEFGPLPDNSPARPRFGTEIFPYLMQMFSR